MANGRRRMVGRVTSNKMEKTIVVSIESRKMHPIYKKVVKTTKKIMAHDESNAIEMGAIVRVVESRPLSKRKRWVVEEVMAANAIAELTVLSDELILTDDEIDETQNDVVSVLEGETVGGNETVADGDAVSEDEASG